MLTIYSTQGSPGASTTAMHLAANWATAGREVLLIEADPAGGSLSHNLGIQFTPGSASFVGSGLPILSNHLIAHAQDVLFENLHVMPAPASPTGARGIFNTFAEFSEDLRTISENEMAVIIDGGRMTADTAASALTTGATGVVVVCRNNSQLPSLEHLRDALAASPGGDGPQACAVTVGKSPMDPEEWQDNYGLTFSGSIEMVADMATDLSAYLGRSKRKSKKWRASLEPVGENLYPLAQPPVSDRPRRTRPATSPETEPAEDAGRAGGTGAAAVSHPSATQDPAALGEAPPMAPPEDFPAYGQPAPPMAPAAGPSHTQTHHLPPTPEPQPSHTQTHHLPPTPEPQPSHTQTHHLPPTPEPQPSHTQTHHLPPTPEPQPSHTQTHHLPPTPEPQPSHTQTHHLPPTAEPQPSHTQTHHLPPTGWPGDPRSPGAPPGHGEAPPMAPPEDFPAYGQPAPPPYPAQQYPAQQYPAHHYEQPPTYQQPPPEAYPAQQYPAHHYEQPPAYEQPPTYRQPAPEAYPPAPGSYEQPQPGAYPPQQHPAHADEPPQPPAYQQPHAQPEPPAHEAARPQPPEAEAPPTPNMQPTGSFRDWAVKLHGSNAQDMTAHRGG